jgi:HK97 gp10 family phage protein
MADRNQPLWDQFDRLRKLNNLKALEAGARVLAAEMRRTVAVDTGYTRDSIDVIAYHPGVAVWAIGGAPFLEFGTVKMRAQPFARPAIDTKRGEISRVVGQLMSKEMSTRL